MENNDEKILKFLELGLDNTTDEEIKSYSMTRRAELIACLSSDEKKLELLSTVENERDKEIIIISLKSDEKKLEFLDTFGEGRKEVYERNFAKTDLIESLVSDEKKLEFLQNPDLEDACKVRIITSLSSDEKKMEFLGNFSNEDVRIEILNSVRSLSDEAIYDEISRKYMRAYTRENVANLICKLSTDEKKLEMIEEHFQIEGINGDYQDLRALRGIICSLSSDNKKLELLDKIPSDDKYAYDRDAYKDEYGRTRVSIICSLSSDDKKIALLDLLDHEDRCRVIASLSSEEKKLEFLAKREYKFDENIIASLSSDDKKLELFNTDLGLPGEDANRAPGFVHLMAKSMTSDDSLLRMLNDVEDDRRKAIIAECISDLGLKLDVIEEMESIYRGLVIDRIFDDAMKKREIKVSALHKLENTLENDDKKDDLREYRRRAYEKLRKEFDLAESSSSEGSTPGNFDPEGLNPEQMAEHEEDISGFEDEIRSDILSKDEGR